MSYPDIAETKPFVHIQVGILGSHCTGNASGWQLGMEGIPTPWKIQYSFSRPSWRQRSPRNCTAAPKKHLLGYWGVFRPPRCHHRCPQGVSHGYFSLLSTGLHPTSGSPPNFSRIFPNPFHRGLHSPALVSPAAPSPGADGFPAGKGDFIQEFPLGLFFGKFLQKVSLGIRGAFQCHPWEGSLGVSNSRKKTFGAREFHSLTTSNGGSLLPLPKTVLEGQKKRRIREETPNPGGNKGGRDTKRCRSPRMGWDWMQKTPEGFPPAPPAQHQIKVTHDAHFPTIPSPPAPYSRDFSRGSPPQPSAVPSRPG